MPSVSEDAEEKLLRLIEALIRQTETGKLGWELIAPPRLETFGVSTRNFTVVLSSRDNDGMYPYRLEILDGTGARVETHLSADFGDGRLIDRISDLFELARGTIQFPPTEIDQLIAELEEGE